jgi:hypothetical protein
MTHAYKQTFTRGGESRTLKASRVPTPTYRFGVLTGTDGEKWEAQGWFQRHGDAEFAAPELLKEVGGVCLAFATFTTFTEPATGEAAPIYRTAEGDEDEMPEASVMVANRCREPEPESYIGLNEKGQAQSFVGPDAVALFRARVIASALRLYAKTGIKANRAYTPTNMLTAATSITGKRYKRGQYELAADDITAWADTMLAALPIVAADTPKP